MAKSNNINVDDKIRMRGSRLSRKAFSLVEVTIALGLASYVLVALLGLFTVGLNQTRESTLGTAFSQITQHVASSYNPASPPDPDSTSAYTYEGVALPQGSTSPQKFFSVKVKSSPSDVTKIADTSANLHLITISITSESNLGVTNIIQTSAFLP